ncbi:hypothetical protein V474_20845 [Novosphingobium barchaimii LL02]|uniref:Uncharacterized protein n=1 Tax=Novosphingobium barchaimii LL02 TaxID=1114963 RepID=A0A0J7XRX6_9SPHN|nr:hypothetical protein V474_12630 [Novosphingobium barchaimii LL02]KMS54427.1 hypothetical protein V474_20845 [Novosphingobium barchaimii LL02]
MVLASVLAMLSIVIVARLLVMVALERAYP